LTSENQAASFDKTIVEEKFNKMDDENSKKNTIEVKEQEKIKDEKNVKPEDDDYDEDFEWF